MLGYQIDQKDRFSVYGSISALLILVAGALGVGVGPIAFFFSALVGFVLGAIVFLKTRSLQFSVILMSVHLILMVTAGVLYFLFLRPLDKNVQKIPSLQYVYSDPDKLFTVRGPEGWMYERVGSAMEAGVRLRPQNQDQYMGVSEVLIFIRKLESKPKSVDDFLKKMAFQNTPKRGEKGGNFEFSAESILTLGAQKALWTIMDAKRYWVPVRHASLIGIKNNLYLCSVSAIGLKTHSTLSKVLCLGLFETLKMKGEK